MPKPEDILHIDSLENMALVLHTGNSEKHQYGTEDYFNEATFLSEEVLNLILSKKPLFIIVDSHGIAEKEQNIFLMTRNAKLMAVMS